MSPAVAPVAGVEVASASEPLSAEEGRTAGTPADEAGEERSCALSRMAGKDALRSAASPVNCWRMFGGNFRVTISELAGLEPAARLARPAVDEPAGMTGEEVLGESGMGGRGEK